MLLKFDTQENAFVCKTCNSGDCEHITGMLRGAGITGESLASVLQEAGQHRRRNAPDKNDIYRVNDSYVTKDLYTISKVGDGSYICNCPDFLSGDVHALKKTAVCRHVTNFKLIFPDENNPRARATDWQKLLLLSLNEKFKEKGLKHYTDAQAYHAIGNLLQRQGLMYIEAEKALKEGREAQVFPLTHFGFEYEAGGYTKEQIKSIIEQSNYAGFVTSNYETFDSNFSINNEEGDQRAVIPRQFDPTGCILFAGSDSSINVPSPFELKTQRLIGLKGPGSLESFTKFIGILSERGNLRIDKSCGMHLHISAAGWTREQMIELARVWMKIKIHVKNLVPPSRRDNTYAKDLTKSDIEAFSTGSFSRNKSLNFTNTTGTFKTFEVRLHNSVTGTKEQIEKKVSAWVIFNLKLFDAVKNGRLKSNDNLGNTPEAFLKLLDRIGITEDGPGIIRANRNFLIKRYNAYRNPNAFPVPASALSRQRSSGLPPAIPSSNDNIGTTATAAIRRIREMTEEIRTNSSPPPPASGGAGDPGMSLGDIASRQSEIVMQLRATISGNRRRVGII